MLKVVKEDLWEVQSDRTWSRPVVVMLRNCEDTKLPVRVCSVCHSGRHGREYEGSGPLPSHHIWLFISGTQPTFKLEVRWEVE